MWWVAAAWASGEATVLEAPALRIDIPQGNIRVTADDSVTQIAIEVDRTRWSTACSLTVAVEGTEAVVRAVRSGSPTHSCRVDVEARIPRATSVVAETSAGNVSLAGTAGGRVRIGLGDLVIAGVTGALDAEIVTQGDLVGSFAGESLTVRVNAGLIRLGGLACPAAVSVPIGKIELNYATAPAGVIDLGTGAGRVAVWLPPQTPVSVAGFDARLGTLVSELPVDEAAPTVLRGVRHTGRVEILAN